MKRPEISVILPTFNRSGSKEHFGYLSDAVSSLRRQQCPVPFEILIGTEIPQAGWPKVRNFLEWLVGADERVKVVLGRYEPRSGHGPTDNALHRLARGRYCTRPLGDDETFRPNFLASLHAALEQEPRDAILAYGDFDEIRADGTPVRERRRGEHSPERLRRECYVGICVLYRKTAWETAGAYGAMIAAEDYDMWKRMAQVGRFVHVPEILGSWRDWSGNLTTRVRKGEIEAGKVYL